MPSATGEAAAPGSAVRDRLAHGLWLAWALLGGRAAGESGLWAFALAWPLAQWWGEGTPAARAWLTALAVAAGIWSTAGLPSAAAVGTAIGVLLALRRRYRPDPHWGWGPPVVLAMLATLWERPGAGALPWPLVLALQGALVVPTLHAVAAFAVRCAPGSAREMARDWHALRHSLAVAAGAGVCIGGLARLPLPVDLRASGIGALVLWGALAPGGQGPAEAALSGAVAAWVAALTGGVGVVAPASGALGGLLAAVLGDGRAWAAGLGFSGGVLATVALAGSGWAWWWGSLPLALWAVLQESPRRALPASAAAPGGAAPGPLPPDLVAQLQAYARDCLDLAQDLARGAAPAQAAAATGSPELQLAEEVCSGCPSVRACWQRRPQRAQRLVAETWAAALAGGVHWSQIGGPDTVYCLRPRAMAEAANRQAASLRQRREAALVLAAGKRGAVGPLLSVGRALQDLSAQVAAGWDALPPASWPLQLVQEGWEAVPAPGCWGYRVAAASLPRAGRGVSGDAYRVRLLSGERLALVLSDGMGSGPPAALAASEAVEHVLAWLGAGLSPEEALQRTNRHLMEAADRDGFATLDLTLVDLRQGTAQWWKLGAPGGLLRRDGEVRPVPGGGLPAGILPEPQARAGHLRLRAGDLLVLVSDGVLEPADPVARRRDGAGGWIQDWLRSSSAAASPRQLAAALVEAARSRFPERHDDLTVMAAVLLAGGEQSPAQGGTRYGARVAAPGAQGSP